MALPVREAGAEVVGDAVAVAGAPVRAHGVRAREGGGEEHGRELHGGRRGRVEVEVECVRRWVCGEELLF